MLCASKLAEEVNLSVSPAWECVRKLEERGVLRGYHADIDWVGLFAGSRFVVEVTLSRHTANDMRRFEEYVLHITARDIDSYQRFIDALLSEHLGVERYFTYVVTKVVKCASVRIPDQE